MLKGSYSVHVLMLLKICMYVSSTYSLTHTHPPMPPHTHTCTHKHTHTHTYTHTVQESALASHQCPVEGPLLDGHLSLIVELLAFRSKEERYRIGSHPDGDLLIKVSVCGM